MLQLALGKGTMVLLLTKSEPESFHIGVVAFTPARTLAGALHAYPDFSLSLDDLPAHAV